MHHSELAAPLNPVNPIHLNEATRTFVADYEKCCAPATRIGRLARAAQKGNRKAFHALVEIFDRKAFFWIRQRVHCWHASEDILQNVWTLMWARRRELRNPDAFPGWFWEFVHRQTRDVVRSRLQRRYVPLPPELVTHYSPYYEPLDRRLIHTEDLLAMRAALKKLKPKERRALELCYVLEQPTPVIERKLNVCQESVYLLKKHGLQKVRRFMGLTETGRERR